MTSTSVCARPQYKTALDSDVNKMAIQTMLKFMINSRTKSLPSALAYTTLDLARIYSKLKINSDSVANLGVDYKDKDHINETLQDEVLRRLKYSRWHTSLDDSGK